MRKIIPAVIAGATALAVAGGTLGYVTANKDVTLSVDGQARNLTTTSGTVADFLGAEGIVLGEHDVVAPAPDTSLADGTRIAVQYGRQVRLTVDGKAQAFWTTATTVEGALRSRRLDPAGGDLSTSRSASIGRDGLAVALATRKTVEVKAGKTERTLRTTAQTVGEALAQAKIKVDKDDITNRAVGARLTNGMRLTVIDVNTTLVTRRRDVDYETINKNTARLVQGENKIDRQGKTGVRTVVYREVRRDGKLASRKKISSKITKDPVDKVVLVGTKKPAPAENGGGGSSGGSSGGGSTPGDSVWDRLAQCETGQRWNTDSVPGYSGGLGFAHSSWTAYGGNGSRAAGHSREEQIAVAKRILADVGWGAWPACSRKLGLR